MEELLNSQPQKLINLSHNQEVEGEVIVITDKEVILDLGSKSEGVISLRDLTNDNLKVGDKIKAFVVDPENESGQVVLSPQQANLGKNRERKATTNINWERITQKYTNQVIKGIVTKITQFGIFVQLEEGIEGLMHSSKLGGTEYKVGDEISVTVDSIDSEKQRIALSPVITSTKGLIYK